MKLALFYRKHGTKALGTAQALISSLAAIPDLFGKGLKYVLALGAVLGVLTVKRGFSNSATAKKE
jgi:hypothetical protein